jgi:hypothetical protein
LNLDGLDTGADAGLNCWCMTAKAHPAGWVVQVTVPALPTPSTSRWIGPVGLGAPSFQYFNVAKVDAHKATEPTRKLLAMPDDDGRRIHAVRQRSSARTGRRRLVISCARSCSLDLPGTEAERSNFCHGSWTSPPRERRPRTNTEGKRQRSCGGPLGRRGGAQGPKIASGIRLGCSKAALE